MPARLLVAVLLLLLPSALHAQDHDWSAGVSVRATLLEAGAGDFLGGGFGGGVHLTRRLGASTALRLEARLLDLDESDPIGSDPTNRLLSFTLGPDLSTRAGPVGLYLRPLAGLAGNLRDGGGDSGPSGSDWTGGYGAAAGVRIFVSNGSLDIGADILRVGRLEFARSSDFIGATSSDSLTAISAHVAVSLALR